jgi:isocitrate dehydrogenase
MYMQDGKLVVPDHVVIPFIEGDGVGAEITPVCQKIVNTAVELARITRTFRKRGSMAACSRLEPSP